MDIQPVTPLMVHDEPDIIARIQQRLGDRSIVLVGMMGCGKSSVGKRLAQRLDMAFTDADTEIETAAAMTIPDIFAARGEAEFRDGEKRVIARLLGGSPLVLATGGGAFMNAQTREHIRDRAVSVWLKAELDVLMRRVRKRANRPLLQTQDPEGTMRRLLDQREPVYALADVTVFSRDDPHEAAVDLTLRMLDGYLASTDVRRENTG
jgi:shikimate kinase